MNACESIPHQAAGISAEVLAAKVPPEDWLPTRATARSAMRASSLLDWRVRDVYLDSARQFRVTTVHRAIQTDLAPCVRRLDRCLGFGQRALLATLSVGEWHKARVA